MLGRTAALTALTAILTAGPAAAQISQVLDPSLTSANWNTSAAIWGPALNGGGGPYNTTWGNAAVAGFQNSSALSVTVAEAVSANGLQFAGTNVSIGGSSTITLSGAGAYILSQNGGLTHTISAPLAGSNGLIVYGTGGSTLTTINLNGANSYTGQTWFRNGFTGPVTVKAGISTSGSTGALGGSTNSLFMESTTTTLDLNGHNVGVGGLTGSGTVTNSSGTAGTFTAGNDNTSTTFDGSLTGNLGLTKAGTGTLTLTGTNSYTGATTISGGTLSVGTLANGGSNSGIGASTNAAANLQFGGGTLRYTGTGSTSTDRSFTLNAGGGTINVQSAPTTLLITGGGTGAGGLTKTGAGILSLAGTNTYAGGTTISAGTLRIGNGTVDGSVSGNILNNATLQFNNPSAGTFAGNITGTGSLSLVGAGLQTFTGTNGYTGTTTLSSAAKVYVAAGATLAASGAGAVTVGSAATLGGEGTIGGSSVAYLSASTLDVGNGTAGDIGTLTFSNALDFQAGAATTFQFDRAAGNAAGVGFDRVNAGGAITLGGSFTAVIAGNTTANPFTTMTVFNGASRTGTFSNLAQGDYVPGLAGFGGFAQWYIDYTATGVNLVPTPEPGTVLGIAAAGLGLAGWVRRRRAGVTSAPAGPRSS